MYLRNMHNLVDICRLSSRLQALQIIPAKWDVSHGLETTVFTLKCKWQHSVTGWHQISKS